MAEAEAGAEAEAEAEGTEEEAETEGEEAEAEAEFEDVAADMNRFVRSVIALRRREWRQRAGSMTGRV